MALLSRGIICHWREGGREGGREGRGRGEGGRMLHIQLNISYSNLPSADRRTPPPALTVHTAVSTQDQWPGHLSRRGQGQGSPQDNGNRTNRLDQFSTDADQSKLPQAMGGVGWDRHGMTPDGNKDKQIN